MSHEDLNLPADYAVEAALISTTASAFQQGLAEGHRALLGVRPEQFLAVQHRLVWGAMQELYRQQIECDVLTVKIELERQGKLDGVGGFTSIVDLFSRDEMGNPCTLVPRVLDLWERRELMKISAKALRNAGDLTHDSHQTLSEIQTDLKNLAEANHRKARRSASAILDRISSGEPFAPGGRPEKLAYFGLSPLDEHIEASPGHVLIIAARPGVGKTALMVQGACISAQSSQKSLMVSLEMGEDELDARLAAWFTGNSARDFRKGHYGEEQTTTLWNAKDSLDRISTWCHPSGVPWSRVEAEIRDAVRAEAIRTVWLDYFTLIGKPEVGKQVNDAAAWGALSTSIKKLAQELNICIVLLSQLNRDGDGGEPKLSDLRETGQLEQDANAVVMLWKTAEETKCKIAKNRSGDSGWKRAVKFEGGTNRFTYDETEKEKGRRLLNGVTL